MKNLESQAFRKNNVKNTLDNKSLFLRILEIPFLIIEKISAQIRTTLTK